MRQGRRDKRQGSKDTKFRKIGQDWRDKGEVEEEQACRVQLVGYDKVEKGEHQRHGLD